MSIKPLVAFSMLACTLIALPTSSLGTALPLPLARLASDESVAVESATFEALGATDEQERSSISGLPADFPLQDGELVTTTFPIGACGNSGGWGMDPFGPVVWVFDVRDPPLFGNPIPVAGADWPAPEYTDPSWIASNLGLVFGLALDEQIQPNIYVAATTVYGDFQSAGNECTMVPDGFGPDGAGAIYKIDGLTGVINSWVITGAGGVGTNQIPNSGSGLGNVCHHAAHDQFFATNHEDGRIYRIDSTGIILSIFDPFAPDDALPGFAELGERLWGIQVHEDRVYFSVWLRDGARANTPWPGAAGPTPLNPNNSIWSIQLDAGTGDFVGSEQLEIVLPYIDPGNPNWRWSSPVSDISFTPGGKMLVAEHSMGGDFGQIDLGHVARVLEFVNIPPWVSSVQEYWIGSLVIGTFGPMNSAGGIDYECDLDVWSTGDVLLFGPTLYGLQRVPNTGNTAATSVSTSYIIGLDNAAKGGVGDVEVHLRDPCGQPPGGVCEPDSTGLSCIGGCNDPGLQCVPTEITEQPDGTLRISRCDCIGECHIDLDPLDLQMFCDLDCPIAGDVCEQRTTYFLDGSKAHICDCPSPDDPLECEVVSVCNPDKPGTCTPACSGPCVDGDGNPTSEPCIPQVLTQFPDPPGGVVISECGCDGACQPIVGADGIPTCLGECPLTGAPCELQEEMTADGNLEYTCRCPGACCYTDAVGLPACIITTQSDCEDNLLGIYLGDNTVCTPDPCPVEFCSLPPAPPAALCEDLQSSDCISDDPTQTCLPICLQIILDPVEGPVPTAVLCDCIDDTSCGPVQIIESAPGDFTVSCEADCTEGTCQIIIDGVATGRTQINGANIPIDSQVKCDCVVLPPPTCEEPAGQTICADLQEDQCTSTDPDTSCEPLCIRIESVGGQVGPVGVLCDCISDDSCGPIEVIPNADPPTDYTLSCDGVCATDEICEVFIDGNATGQSSVNASDVAVGSQVCCDCAPDPPPDVCPEPMGPGLCVDLQEVDCVEDETGELCLPNCVNYDEATGVVTALSCDCKGPQDCHVIIGADGTPTCDGICPDGTPCEPSEKDNPNGGIDICCGCCPATELRLNLSTGVDADGNNLPILGDDDTWAVIGEPPPIGTLPRPATVINPHPAWAVLPGSQWISANTSGPNGEYIYETCFCLDERARNPNLTVELLADDQAFLFLNGFFVGQTPSPGFLVPTLLETSDETFFLPGETNCITVEVENQYGVVTGFDMVAWVVVENGQCCCGPTQDGSACEQVECPIDTEQCLPTCIQFDPMTGEQTVIDCECRDEDQCHPEILPPAEEPACVGNCPDGEECIETITQDPGTGIITICCDCQPIEVCQEPAGEDICSELIDTDCIADQPGQTCLPKAVRVVGNQVIIITHKKNTADDILIAGLPPVFGDTICMIGQDPIVSPTQQTRIDNFFVNTGPVEMTFQFVDTIEPGDPPPPGECPEDRHCTSEQECIFDGLQNLALGEAMLELTPPEDGCNLVVGRIGSSGQDGVRQAPLPPGTTVMTTGLAKPNFSFSEMGTSARIQMFADVPGELLSTMSIDNFDGANLVVQGDISPAGVTLYTIQILHKGQLVAEFNDLPEAVVTYPKDDLMEMDCKIKTTKKVVAEECDCFDGGCGPVEVTPIDDPPTEYLLSCPGMCPVPPPGDDCQIHIDGEPTGQSTVTTANVPLDSVVTCECAQCAEPPSNMTAWWPLDEDSGTTSVDIINGNDGTHTNGPTPLIGEFVDNSLCFDGMNDYVAVPSAAELNFGTGNFSIDAWIRTASTTGVHKIVDKRVEAGSTTGYSLFVSSGLLAFQIADGVGSSVCASCPGSASCTNYSSGAFVATDEWEHVAVTVDRSTGGGTFYRNGAVVGVFNPDCHPASVSNPNPLRIGSRSSSVSGLFDGCIDEVELFDRVLGIDEIQAIFEAGALGKCKPAIGACCLDIDDGPLQYDTCIETDEESCLAMSGIFNGVGVTCEIEACCLPGGQCQDADPGCCIESGGTPMQGDCSQVDCPEPEIGACCFDADGDGVEETCAVMSVADCAVLLGTFRGIGSICLGDMDGNGVDDRCQCPADLNGDGMINAADLAALLGSWGPCPNCPADLNGDGVINAADLAALLGSWGGCP